MPSQPTLYAHCSRCSAFIRQRRGSFPRCSKCKSALADTQTTNKASTLYVCVNVAEAAR